MTATTRTRSAALALALTGVVLAGCGDDAPGTSATTTSTAVAPVIDPGDGGQYEPMLDPADFVAEIDNPYLPLRPGSRWQYEGTVDGVAEAVEVVVTDQTKVVGGITATVVRDTVTAEGELVEDTYDWFAQDHEGNVWYLGEDTKEYEGGQVTSTEGSWEHGVDGAFAGIVMPADPTVGDAYRQEFRPGEAEDLGEVLAVGEQRTVAAGTYDDVVRTREWTPLEPEVVEEKSYAPGVGQIFEEATAGEAASLELVAYEPGE